MKINDVWPIITFLFELLHTYFLMWIAVFTSWAFHWRIPSFRQVVSNELCCVNKNRCIVLELYSVLCISNPNISLWWIVNWFIASLKIKFFFLLNPNNFYTGFGDKEFNRVYASTSFFYLDWTVRPWFQTLLLSKVAVWLSLQ